MLSQAERNQIIDLINREVVPAIGCTEPIAVALCTARAAETLGGEPEKITVRLSANILKNAMGVGIPGTGMIGLPIAGGAFGISAGGAARRDARSRRTRSPHDRRAAHRDLPEKGRR